MQPSGPCSIQHQQMPLPAQSSSKTAHKISSSSSQRVLPCRSWCHPHQSRALQSSRISSSGRLPPAVKTQMAHKPTTCRSSCTKLVHRARHRVQLHHLVGRLLTRHQADRTASSAGLWTAPVQLWHRPQPLATLAKATTAVSLGACSSSSSVSAASCCVVSC